MRDTGHGPGPVVRLLIELLVRAYPRAQRERYGYDMREAHRDAWAAEARGRGGLASAGFWLRAFGSSVRASASLRAAGVHESVRHAWGFSFQAFRLHAMLATRGLRRSPSFVVLSVVALGAGIGGATGLLAVADAALRDPLPFPDAGDLYRVTATRVRGEDPVPWPMSHADWMELSQRATQLEAVAVRSGARSLNVTSDAGPRSVTAELISANYFAVLGIPAMHGRAFTAEEDAAPAGAPVAVLSHAFWSNVLRGDRMAIGRTIRVNDLPYTIIGVMPEGFRGETGAAELWLPVRQAYVIYDDGYVENRRLRWLTAVGRARAGVAAATISADVAAVGRALEADHPDANADLGLSAVSLREAWYGEVRLPLLALLAGSGLALLVVSLNLASVQTSRGLAGRHEADVCRALGAPRGSLLGRWAAEGGVLAGAGLMAGLGVAAGIIAVATGPARELVRAEVGLGAQAIAAAVLLAVLSAGILVITPALSSGTGAGPLTIAGGRRGGFTTRSGSRVRRLLVVGQLAFTTALCMTAVLLGASLHALQRIDLGFDPGRLLAMRADLLGPSWEEDAPKRLLAREFLREIESVPGIETAALAGPGGVPTAELFGFYFAVERDSEPAWRDESVLLSYHLVTPGYFDALGIELLDGRLLADADDTDAPGAAVVTRALARRFWPDGDALGRRLRMGSGETAPWFTVVGIIADPRFEGRARTTELDGPEHVFLPFVQKPPSLPSRMNVLFSGRGPVEALAAGARRAMATTAPGVPLQDPVPIASLLDRQTALDRLLVGIALAFAALALIVASLGVHAVVAQDVRQRRHELGVRLALGATPRGVGRMVVGKSASLVLAGLVLGTVLAVGAGRLMQSLLFGISALHAPGFILVVFILMASGVAAALGPAREAVRTDPARVLAGEGA